jgi:hypothetical protein
MNKRIHALAQQTDIWCDQNHAGDKFYDVRWEEKFAELIVKECAQVCLSQRDPANLNYKPSVKFAEAVKHHFGVKE